MKRYRKDCNMPVVQVVSQYDEKVNAVRETVVDRGFSIKRAEDWLNATDKPAHIYVDGMQNHDAFLDFFWESNEMYKKEYKKVID